MSAANVIVQEIDLSTRVPSFPGVYGYLQIPNAAKGPVGESQLVTSDTQLYSYFTPNDKIEVGYDLAYYSALAFLQQSNKLWITRVVKDDILYGGLVLQEENYALKASLLVDCANTLSDITFTAVTAGVAGNSITITYTDPAAVDTDLVVGVSGTDIDIQLETNGTASIISTATEISAAISTGETAATVNMDSTPADSDVAIVADTAGAASNTLNITFTDPGAPTSALSVSVVGGTDIDVSLETDGGSAIISIANDIATLLNTDPGTSGLVVATPEGVGTGVVEAIVQAYFTGGNDDASTLVEAAAEGAGTGVVEDKASAPLAGGSDISANEEWSAGETDPDSYVFGASEAITIYGANPGEWNNDIGIRVYKYYASEVFTVDTTENLATVSQFWSTGIPVKFSTISGTLPDPLEAGTYYYVINVTDTTIKIADSYANAVAGTAITFTTTGTGDFQIQPVFEKCKEPGAFIIEIYKSNDTVNPIETHVCSRTQGTKDGNGQNIFIEDKLQSSMYVLGITNPLVADDIYPREQIELLYLTEGDNGSPVTDSDMLQAINNNISGIDSRPVTLIMDGGWATPAYQKQGILQIAENRKDCVGLLSVPYDKEASASYLNDIVDYRKTILNANSSFGGLYTPHPKIYDLFNDRSIYVSPDGYAGSVISYTASNYEMWYPPAGFRRGIIKVLDLRRRFTKGEMDYLYDNGINPLRFAPGRGILFWGQKTLLARPSALDRMNVRLLLVVIEPAIREALEDFIFELNDAATRAMVTTLIEQYMNGIQSRRGVYEFKVVCDDSNNVPADIDNYIMNVWLFVKPTKAIEYVPFKVIITTTGMDFSLAQEQV